MPKRWLILAILAAGILAALTVMVIGSREPSYKGQPLSAWVTNLANPDSPKQVEATNAVRQMGKEAVPHLIRWLQGPPRTWSSSMYRGYSLMAGHLPTDRLRGWAMIRHINLMKQQAEQEIEWVRRRPGLMAALSILRAEAATAIPGLTRALNQPPLDGSDVATRRRARGAAFALAAIGGEGLPPLLAATASSQPFTRDAAVVAVSRMERNAIPPVPTLARLLGNTNAAVRDWATNALRNIAPEALTNSAPP